MATIKYHLSGDRGEWTHLSDSCANTLTLLFTPRVSGYLLIDKVAYRVEYGEASLPKEALRDGEYAPMLKTDGAGYELESFSITREGVVMSKTDDKTVRRLLARTRLAEEKIAELDARVAELERKTEGHHIFN